MHTAEVRIVYGISSDIPGGKLKLKNCIATDPLSNSIVRNILIKLIHIALYPQQVNFFLQMLMTQSHQNAKFVLKIFVVTRKLMLKVKY